MNTQWNQLTDDIIKDLIAEVNTGFDDIRDSFTLSNLQVIPDDEFGRNTTIDLVPTDTSDYEGTVTIKYRRIPFADYLTGVFDTTSPVIPWYTEDGHHLFDEMDPNLRTYLNEALGLQFVRTDVEISVDADASEGYTLLTIKLEASNLLFVPNTYHEIKFQGRIAVGSWVITNTALDGLVAPTT